MTANHPRCSGAALECGSSWRHNSAAGGSPPDWVDPGQAGGTASQLFASVMVTRPRLARRLPIPSGSRLPQLRSAFSPLTAGNGQKHRLAVGHDFRPGTSAPTDGEGAVARFSWRRSSDLTGQLNSAQEDLTPVGGQRGAKLALAPKSSTLRSGAPAFGPEARTGLPTGDSNSESGGESDHGQAASRRPGAGAARRRAGDRVVGLRHDCTPPPQYSPQPDSIYLPPDHSRHLPPDNSLHDGYGVGRPI